MHAGYVVLFLSRDLSAIDVITEFMNEDEDDQEAVITVMSPHDIIIIASLTRGDGVCICYSFSLLTMNQTRSKLLIIPLLRYAISGELYCAE